jgi:hypothetical protein
MDAQFDNELWIKYAREISDELPYKCIADSQSYDFIQDVLPILENTMNEKSKLEEAHISFIRITQGLERRLEQIFSIDLQCEIILYLGLCNGAGWATTLDGKPVILIGIEKIIELDWCDESRMSALIYHELGHIWHDQVGVLHLQTSSTYEKSLWQLYIEGVAMYCEQMLIGDYTYYHQNRNDWLEWCNNNQKELFAEYKCRIDANGSTQDFFGDWCDYKGYSDVGYYLGCELIKGISNKYTLKELANLKIDVIYSELHDRTK